MWKKYGFTLVEVLFVVLIAAGVMVFAVPAYKRAQERADYNAALGTLLEVSNAVTALRRDLRMSTGSPISVPSSGDWIKKGTPNWTGKAPYTDAEKAKTWNQYVVESPSGTSRIKAFMWALHMFYLKNIPDTKGYDFYILNGNSATLMICQVEGKTPVACMLKTGTANDCYKGAVVLADGSVQRITGDNCKN